MYIYIFIYLTPEHAEQVRVNFEEIVPENDSDFFSQYLKDFFAIFFQAILFFLHVPFLSVVKVVNATF